MLHKVAGVMYTIVTLPFASTVKTSSSKIGVVAESLSSVKLAGFVLTINVLSVILAGNWLTGKFCTVTLYLVSFDVGLDYLTNPA